MGLPDSNGCREHNLLHQRTVDVDCPVYIDAGGIYFYRYLKKTKNTSDTVARETIVLTISWIVASFILDAIVYIAVFPLVLGYHSNWTFFIDQSPLIWLNYATIIVLGQISRLIYQARH